ncbi:hypothetical protein NESM_000940400 [Novymonas esmeraldas]|uniref:Uncharacterized protein n=1 Tax=Novymonas esmeraldas TaxID=1808958 RepID=A0AAW0F1Y3_9TRYP
MLQRLRSPPDSPASSPGIPTFVSRQCRSRSTSSASSTRSSVSARSVPRRVRSENHSASYGVDSGEMTSSCVTKPSALRKCRSKSASPSWRRPLSRSCPPDGSRSQMAFRNVVLPAPDEPRIARQRPGSAVPVSPHRIRFLPAL